MTDLIPQAIRGERSLRDGEPDRLGFGEVADRITNAIVDRASADGLVIGLDGEWGSGKSSLLHIIERALGALPAERRPTLIRFSPWLLGNRDALLTELFGDLAGKIASAASAQGDATRETKEKAKKAAERIRRFARAVGRAGELLEAGEAVFVPLGWGGRLLRGFRTMAENQTEAGDEQRDLASLKAAITDDLRSLGHRFIVTIDDVDRLEPAEVIEVLRLVRSVADFPNVIYILCYDVERLSEAIEASANIDDGTAFLEKIVQLTVMVPKPEPFELRQWFSQEIGELTGPLRRDVHERLLAVIDQEGGAQLRTPRSVARTLDSIRFLWPALRDERVDVADLVWLQLIKDGSPQLYRWIETYVASMAASSFGTARMSDASIAARLAALHDIVPADQIVDFAYRQLFAEILPGIEPGFGDDDEPVRIHQQVEADARRAAIAGRRLASPDHYRLYFSLVGPKHAITQAAFDRFWAAADTDPVALAAAILGLHGEQSFGALRKSDVLFERLREMDRALWTSRRAANVLLALASVMDDIYRESGGRELMITTWSRATRLLPILFAAVTEEDRGPLLLSMFGSGAAIEWVTDIFRRETFAHGRYGDRAQAERDWYLTDPELDTVSTIMIARYRALGLDEIVASPNPLNLLFAWSQAGDADGPPARMSEALASDERLVTTIEKMTTIRDSSDRGRHDILTTENVSPFLDFEDVLRRLEAIGEGADIALAERARALLAAARAARRF